MFWPDVLGHLEEEFYNIQCCFNLTVKISHMIKIDVVVNYGYNTIKL